jgi:hypothetical protein
VIGSGEVLLSRNWHSAATTSRCTAETSNECGAVMQARLKEAEREAKRLRAELKDRHTG